MTRKKVSPLAWVPTAYFAMGLPFIMLNLVAPIMFNDFGISDAQVAFWTSLLILPWSLKPFWSPLLEMYRTKKFFVVTTQLLSGVSLAPGLQRMRQLSRPCNGPASRSSCPR